MAEADDVIATLLSRRSVPALQLSAPGPSASQIETAIDAALRAPDHGALRPWRFVLIEGAARERLGQLLMRRLPQLEPSTVPAKLDKIHRQTQSAPLIIAVGARIVSSHKVPEIEQLLAVGAGVMNLLNAFHAQGFGAIWLTGANGYDRLIADALGFAADERNLGLVYVGTAPPSDALPRRASREAHLRRWGG